MNRIVRAYATSDLVTDQRVHRTAMAMSNAGFDVIVTGRKPTLSTINNKPYKIRYIRSTVSKGPLFYVLFNFRIFVNLVFSKFSLAYANDLDTLPGCWLASVIRFKPLVYDSHELFSEVPELIGHPIKKMIWRLTERICIKKASVVFAVSDGVAQELKRRYRIAPIVVRNVPIKKEIESFKDKRPTLIYQGALNVGRGIELAIDVMNYLTCYRLIIIGTGDIEIQLRKRMLDQKLFDRVEFVGRVKPHDLHKLTCTAWLGLSLEEDMGLNYRYALPNKVFDYINAQVPVLVSNLPEMRKLVEDYNVGIVATSKNAPELANQIADFFEDKKLRAQMEINLQKASMELNWGKEEVKLTNPIKSIFA
ncbi:MAG: glycosyltransferase [Bacteroidales bacterium]